MEDFITNMCSGVAINLCDVFARLFPDFEKNLQKLLDRASKHNINRVYIGSYFCDHYFTQVSESKYRSILYYCAQHQIAVTIVVPPLFQENYQKGIRLVSLLAENNTVDEIVVNDWGLISNLSLRDGVKLILGRLLQKDNRDPRYKEFFEEPYTSRLFTSFYQRFLAEKTIAGIEIDCTHQWIKIPPATAPDIICVHYPFCYISIGSICEFASMNKPAAKKFRFADTCRCECNAAAIRCLCDNGKDLIRIGRGVLFENRNCRIESGRPFRCIYSPYVELGVLDL